MLECGEGTCQYFWRNVLISKSSSDLRILQNQALPNHFKAQ